MPTVADLVAALESIAPTRYAESWDNVGLLVGDPAQDLTRVMLTIDYTPAVACEAAGEKCDAVIAYHPPIFKPLLSRVTASGASAAVFDAIRRGVAIYSPHTALDVAEGGTNDVLADALGLAERWPLKVSEDKPSQYKLVTFVPETSLEKVSAAIFAAGAGRIGHYSACSFRTAGTGTFFGEAGSDPTVGKSGQFERVPEVKIETVVPTARVDAVVNALRAAHPYEEPAFDLNVLGAAPEGHGIGRIGDLPAPTERQAVFERIKRELELPHLLIAGPTSGSITRAAVCAGACGDLLDQAIGGGAQLYLTGEMRHHDALKAANAGLTVVCTLHSNSERATLKRLAAMLSGRLPELPMILSRKDRDPFEIL
ncbi:Nif3-like dinuclear metal center hexameric protein [Humisphaera borealis]|uniref:GTP cyclohydrolase 1 type 2 homolog n=1 Tax=Humisphaera borealis TaxID=2807512 RepID=A0A7M2WZG4_9BACT|nr:Nif3-like dinuclear metal center hexameric protein [Humisphaera borealis]QOV89880.1 Nif3-like dinuclear metal center hexameric protein [Humisphaera borealis]